MGVDAGETLRHSRAQLLEDRDAELERMDAQLSQSNQTLGKREAELQVGPPTGL